MLGKWTLWASLGLMSGHAMAMADITWAINPGPPFHIEPAPKNPVGLCDQLLDSLTPQLPDLKQTRLKVPQGRVKELLTEPNSRMCFPCMIKRGERSDGIRYSDVTHHYPPVQLLMLESKFLQAFPQFPARLSLQELMTQRGWIFGYPQGRRYAVIQPLIEQQQQAQPSLVVARTGDGEAGTVLELIRRGRIDYTVDYPMVLKYYLLTHPEATESGIRAYPLQENQGQAVAGAIGCPDSPWGESMIQRLNQAIPALRQDPVFLHSLQFWQGQESLPAVATN